MFAKQFDCYFVSLLFERNYLALNLQLLVGIKLNNALIIARQMVNNLKAL